MGELQQTLKYNADLYFSDTRSIVFSLDFLQVAFGPTNNLIRILDITLGKVRLTLEGHLDKIRLMIFLLNSKWLASGAHNKAVKLWDIIMRILKYTL